MRVDDSLFRSVKSFVRRQGRITAAQKQALETLLPVYGLEISERPFNFTDIYGANTAVVLEIGFGNGESLATMAENNPEKGYLGIEVHTPGVGNLLQLIQEKSLTNVRVVQGDALDIMRDNISALSLAGVQIFFPDPWHKKRHLKRRLIQRELVELLSARLKPGGFIHMATDWRDYAEQMLAVFESSSVFENQSPAGNYFHSPYRRPETKFERRGIRLGHQINDLYFRRKKE